MLDGRSWRLAALGVGLGRLLADTALLSTASHPEILAERFEQYRLGTAVGWLDDLDTSLPPRSAAVVRATLADWEQRVARLPRSPQGAIDPAEVDMAVIGALRQQGDIWRRLLTGEQRPDQLLDRQAYRGCHQAVRRCLAHRSALPVEMVMVDPPRCGCGGCSRVGCTHLRAGRDQPGGDRGGLGPGMPRHIVAQRSRDAGESIAAGRERTVGGRGGRGYRKGRGNHAEEPEDRQVGGTVTGRRCQQPNASLIAMRVVGGQVRGGDRKAGTGTGTLSGLVKAPVCSHAWHC